MKSYFFCFLLVLINTYNYAQPRFLDSSFGNNGKVVTDFGSQESINSIAFQNDGKIIAAGYYDLIKVISFDEIACALARYKTNGELDSSFGKNGLAYFKPVFASLKAITVQNDDKIVGAGYAYPVDQLPAQIIILRSKKNGALDSSFGKDGIVYFGDLKTNFIGTAMAVQSDGNFVVAGFNNTLNEGDSSFVLAVRFNNNGTVDSAFGVNGSKKIVVGFQSFATGVVVNSKGEIIIAGYNTTSSEFSQPFIIGLTSSGNLNNNFGVKGIAAIQLKDNAGFATITLTKNEKIIAAGNEGVDNNSNFFLVRFSQKGKVDPAFGTNGFVNSDLGYSDKTTSIVIQSNDKIIAAGRSFDAGANKTYFALSRYYSNGELDNSFGTQGRILTAFSGRNSFLSKVLLQPDGKIVAGGTSSGLSDGYGDFALSRYKNDDNTNNKVQPAFALNSDAKKPLPLIVSKR